MRQIRLCLPASVRDASAMSRRNVFFRCGSSTGSNSLNGGTVVAAVGERSPAAQEQQSAAAAIDKLLDHLLLRVGEVPALHTSQNQSVKGEKIVWFGRESIRQLAWIFYALPVQLVLRGAQQRDDMQRRIILHSAAQELIFPARLAFHVQNAARAAIHCSTRVRRLFCKFCSPARGSIEA